MQDLTCEDFWKGRRHVSSFMDRVLMRGQVRQLAAPCINISPDFSLKRQDLLPQKSGFVGSEIKFCGGENVRGIPGKASFQLSPPRGRVSLFKTVSQSTVEMKIEEEISGRQTVSIKPHSRLTNKLEEGPKERAQAAPAKYLDIWIQNNIEYQYLFVLKPNIYGRTCFIQEIQSDSSPKSVRSHSKSHLKSSQCHNYLSNF